VVAVSDAPLPATQILTHTDALDDWWWETGCVERASLSLPWWSAPRATPFLLVSRLARSLFFSGVSLVFLHFSDFCSAFFSLSLSLQCGEFAALLPYRQRWCSCPAV